MIDDHADLRRLHQGFLNTEHASAGQKHDSQTILALLDENARLREALKSKEMSEENVGPESIKLVPVLHRVINHVMAEGFQWFGWPWMLKFPILIVRRKTLQGWTENAIDQAVYRTAKVFRGEELP